MRAKSEDGTRILTFDSLDEFKKVTGLSGPAEEDISSVTTAGTTLTTGGTTTVIPTATATIDISSATSTITAYPLPGATTISIPARGVDTVKIDIEDFIKGLQRRPENEERITLRKFLERYRLEPRGDTASKWMVIYDKKNNTYVKDTKSKSKRAYLKFNDTDEVLDFFKEYNKEV